jgi:hypothetical protein
MAEEYYNTAFKKFMDADIDLLSDTIVALLLDNTYTPDIDNHEFIDDVSGDEIAGGGYARQTLAGKTTTVDNSTDRCEFSSNSITGWNGDTFTGARYMVIAKNTGADATSPIIVYYDFLADKTAPFNVNVPVDGWFALGACP